MLIVLFKHQTISVFLLFSVVPNPTMMAAGKSEAFSLIIYKCYKHC